LCGLLLASMGIYALPSRRVMRIDPFVALREQ
jgi:hypothetical protein